MKLIIGLGNPGEKFNNTRHNIGFDAIDHFAQSNNLTFSNKHKSLFVKGKDFIMIKPQTFMNNSGEAVAEVIKFYKIKIENILVIYDDVSIDVGDIRTKPSGSAGGQNGMKNIIKLIGTDNFWRTRLGVGNNSNYNLSDWVLSKFKKDEVAIKEEVIKNTKEIINLFLMNKTTEIMNRYN